MISCFILEKRGYLIPIHLCVLLQKDDLRDFGSKQCSICNVSHSRSCNDKMQQNHFQTSTLCSPTWPHQFHHHSWFSTASLGVSWCNSCLHSNSSNSWFCGHPAAATTTFRVLYCYSPKICTILADIRCKVQQDLWIRRPQNLWSLDLIQQVLRCY